MVHLERLVRREDDRRIEVDPTKGDQGLARVGDDVDSAMKLNEIALQPVIPADEGDVANSVPSGKVVGRSQFGITRSEGTELKVVARHWSNVADPIKRFRPAAVLATATVPNAQGRHSLDSHVVFAAERTDTAAVADLKRPPVRGKNLAFGHSRKGTCHVIGAIVLDNGEAIADDRGIAENQLQGSA